MNQRWTDSAEKMEFLRKLPTFRHLSVEQQDLLGQRLRLRRFAPRERIFHQGDEGDGLYVIAQGHVHVSITSLNGQERIVRVLSAGHLLGELALLDQEPRAASALAINKTLTLALHKDDFYDILKNHPAILVTMLLTELAARVRYADTHAEILTDPSVQRRIIRLLILLAQSHEGADESQPSTIEFNQAQLGAMVGTTRETVNRIIRALQDKGAITLSTRHGRRCITILSLAQMHEELERAEVPFPKTRPKEHPQPAR